MDRRWGPSRRVGPDTLHAASRGHPSAYARVRFLTPRDVLTCAGVEETRASAQALKGKPPSP